MSVAMSNPTTGADKSDSSGRFPQIYAAEDLICDIILKDASGVQIGSYLGVNALGSSNSTTIARDFGPGGRLLISGSGAVVSFEGGPPTGVNIGGDVRVGGYLGTQADTLELDAAATTATGAMEVTGDLTNGGFRVNTLSTGTIGGASTIIPIPTGIRAFTLDLSEMVLTNSTQVQLTASIDGGGTYLGAASYDQSLWTPAGLVDDPARANIDVIGYTPALGVRLYSEIKIDVPLTGSGENRFRIRGDSATAAYASMPIGFINGRLHTSAVRVTHIKIAPSAGTFTGLWALSARAR